MAKPEEKTILVVDDEEDIREYFASVLEDAGFRVMTAADGNEALAKLEEKVPDFISLDLVMPNKSGIKFLHEIRRRKEWSRIPFVIVTAHAADPLGKNDLEDILASKTFSGPGVYLEKPVSPEQYLGFFCRELNVECPKGGAQKKSEQIQGEIEKLLEEAGPEEIEKVIRMLQEKRKQK